MRSLAEHKETDDLYDPLTFTKKWLAFCCLLIYKFLFAFEIIHFYTSKQILDLRLLLMYNILSIEIYHKTTTKFMKDLPFRMTDCQYCWGFMLSDLCYFISFWFDVECCYFVFPNCGFCNVSSYRYFVLIRRK